MEENVQNSFENKENGTYVIDIAHIFKILLQKIWLIALLGILAGAIAFIYVTFAVTPQYSSTVMLYVNNKYASEEPTNSITTGDITASRNLVDTMVVILKNSDILEDVIKQTESKYTYRQLLNMISASAVNNTEVLAVSVTASDPYEAHKLATIIGELLPEKVENIIDGSSVRIVAPARLNLGKVSPNVVKYVAIGVIIGILIAVAIIILADMMKSTIRSTDYLIQKYNVPILGEVPDLNERESEKYYNKYKYYYGYGSKKK